MFVWLRLLRRCVCNPVMRIHRYVDISLNELEELAVTAQMRQF